MGPSFAEFFSDFSQNYSARVDFRLVARYVPRYRTLCEQPRDADMGYVGCFKDEEISRDLPYLALSIGAAPGPCAAECREKGFKYFGLQEGKCFCGMGPGRYGRKPEAKCAAKCAANKGRICGGLNKHSSVYSLARDFVYVGCFRDPHFPVHGGSGFTQDVCASACENQGSYHGYRFKFFLLKDGGTGDCWCGQSLARTSRLNDTACSETCVRVGAKNEGDWGSP